MITKEDIEVAAYSDWNNTIQSGSSWIAAMARKRGFQAGAKWAIERMKAGEITITEKPTLSKR